MNACNGLVVSMWNAPTRIPSSYVTRAEWVRPTNSAPPVTFGTNSPPRVASANLIAGLPEPATRAPARVIFMAHYDTKSQLWPTGVRVVLVYIATALGTLLALLSSLAALGFPQALQVIRLDLVAAGA